MPKFEKGNQVGRRFRPGQSGNPRGRPRIKPLREAARRLLNSADDDGRDKAELAIEAIYARAMSREKGSLHWMKLLIAIAEGKPAYVDDDEPTSRLSDGRTDGRGPGHEEKA